MKAIKAISATLVLLLACASFVLSYDALYRTALANGITPALAWLWPLCLDAAMVTVSLAVLRNSLLQERTWYQWLLAIAFTAASVIVNALHAQPTALSRFVFALAPTVTFIAFELLMQQIKSEARRRGASQSLRAIQDAIARARQELQELQSKADAIQPATPVQAIEWVPPQAQPEPIAYPPFSREALAAYRAMYPDAPNTQAAQHFNVAPSTISRALKARRNGHDKND